MLLALIVDAKCLVGALGGASMPSTSPAQARLMAAAAHTKGGYGGVPQAVGEDFNQADKGTAMLSRSARQRAAAAVLRASARRQG